MVNDIELCLTGQTKKEEERGIEMVPMTQLPELEQVLT